MIPPTKQIVEDWSDNWNLFVDKENRHYLMYRPLSKIACTRLQCVRISPGKETIERPCIELKCFNTHLKCVPFHINQAFDISASEIKGAPSPRLLIEKKAQFIYQMLQKINFFCSGFKCDTSEETLVNTIRSIEKNKSFWFSMVAGIPGRVYAPDLTPMSILVTSTGDYIMEFEKKVQHATCKRIHEAYVYNTGQHFVVLRPQAKKEWKREVLTYKKIREAAARGKDVSFFVPTPYITTEFAIQPRCQCDMTDIVGHLSPMEKLNAACKIAKALVMLHSLGRMHGDVKLENVLYLKGDVFLTDFGLSKSLKNKKVYNFFGTGGLCAPELLEDAIHYDKTEMESVDRDFAKFDSFSFGVLLWGLCYHALSPFDAALNPSSLEPFKKQLNEIAKLPKPPKISLGRVMRGCWKIDPDKRWAVKRALNVLSEMEKVKDPACTFVGCRFYMPVP